MDRTQSIYDREMRRRRLQEALLQQSMTPQQTQYTPGRFSRAVPYSPWQGLTQIGQALIARGAMDRSDERIEEAVKEQEDKRKRLYEGVMKTYEGTPAQPAVTESLLGPPQFPEGEQVLQEAVPAVPGDPRAAMLQAAAHPETEAMAKYLALAQPKPTKPSYAVVPEMQPSGKWRNREVISGQKAGLVGEEYEKGAGATDIDIGASDKYAEERMKKQAVRIDDLSKAAKSAYSESQALDRFISQAGTATAGGAQPIVTGVKNFLSTFGYDDKSLTSVKVMEQAIGDMKVNKIAQFGARGLTDKDMEVIHQSLPRINTDPTARVEIAKILKKVHDNTIQDYIYAREEEAKSFPKVSQQIINPRWLREYKLQQPPEGVDPKLWNLMTLEERALWQ